MLFCQRPSFGWSSLSKKPKRQHVFFSSNKTSLVDGTTDFAFKRLFKKKELIVPFINDVFSLERQDMVQKITHLVPQLGHALEDKAVTLDFLCEDGAGKNFLVEIQRVKQPYFYERVLYNWAKDVSYLGHKGKDWDWDWNSTPVYVLALCDFKFFENVNWKFFILTL